MGTVRIRKLIEMIHKGGWTLDDDDGEMLKTAAYDDEGKILYLITADSFFAFCCEADNSMVQGNPAYIVSILEQRGGEPCGHTLIHIKRMMRQKDARPKREKRDSSSHHNHRRGETARKTSVALRKFMDSAPVNKISVSTHKISITCNNRRRIEYGKGIGLTLDGIPLDTTNYFPVTVAAE